MTFQISDRAHIGKVVLKVNDLDKMTTYYRDQIGLDLLSQEGQVSQLGIKEDGEVLIELRQLDQVKDKRTATGLYHLALLLPTRKDLGNVLKRFQQTQVGLTGASNHGYSEALYLYDPELNGIEIYRDKDMSEWDIDEDGTIHGITERMDAEGVYAAADVEPPAKMPSGTIMGHVHLQVSDLENSKSFLGDVIGMGLKTEFGDQALFYAAGDYHHHIGNNVWATRDKPANEADAPGLDYFEIVVPDLNVMTDHFDQIDYDYKSLSDQEVSLMHPDG